MTVRTPLVLLATLLAALVAVLAAATVPVEARPAEAFDYTWASYRDEGSPPEFGVAPLYNRLFLTRDGDEMAADVYLPADAAGEALPGPWPTVFQCTPYDKQSGPTPSVHEDAAFFTPRGYAVVVADIPGEGNSSGSQPEGILTMRTIRACYDAVEWIAARSWSDGEVGMHGDSFPGFIAQRTAALAPPHLTAAIPVTADADYYLDTAYPGGLFALNNQAGFGLIYGEDQAEPPNLLLDDDAQRLADIYGERILQSRNLLLATATHPVDGDWWDDRSADPRWGDVRASMLQFGGWRDLFSRGNVNSYVGVKDSVGARDSVGVEDSRAPVNRLVMGPFSHTDRGDIDEQALKLWFWDSELKGMQNGVRDAPPFQTFIRGAEEWRSYPDYPVPGTTRSRWYLSEGPSGSAVSLNDGVLQRDPPAGEQTPDLIAYEPATAGFGEGGELFEAIVAPADQRVEEVKKLTYTTPVFDAPTLVLGSPRVRLFASSDAAETQFSVKVTDVSPDGTSTLIKEGWLNATHRRSPSEPEPLEPGTVYEFDIEVWQLANEFQPGHRLRVDLALSDFPRVLGSPLPSTVSVYHDAERPSSIDLPVVEVTSSDLGGDAEAGEPAGGAAPPAAGGGGLPATGGGFVLLGSALLAGAGLTRRR